MGILELFGIKFQISISFTSASLISGVMVIFLKGMAGLELGILTQKSGLKNKCKLHTALVVA